MNFTLFTTFIFNYPHNKHILHLHIILLVLHLSLSNFFLISSLSHFFLSLFHISLLHLLFFNKCWIWLHVYWDNKSCKSISSHDSSIVHNILWCYLTVMNKIKWVRFLNFRKLTHILCMDLCITFATLPLA